mmetsp:Transcript_14684/g.33390  ORF Transcript_14684/g.33390 Transcript_14684/m.33390 type:complete len:315 (-) Transcript_14684:287-1231(-)
MPWKRGSTARRVQSTLWRTSALFSSRVLTVSSISLYLSRNVSICSKVVATMRPTWPSPSRCAARMRENVRLASPTTSASALGSMSSRRLNLLMVRRPFLSGAASVALSSSGIVMPASSVSSSMVRLPSKLVTTYLKSLWHSSRSCLSSSAVSCHRCLKAAMTSTEPPAGHFDSRARLSLSATCSAHDFWPSRPSYLLGCQPDFCTASTSSSSAASTTYLAARSLLSFHLARTAAFTPSSTRCTCASPPFRRRFLAAPPSTGWLSVDRRRFSVRLPSTDSRMSSGTSSKARSSSRRGTSSSSSSSAKAAAPLPSS